MLLSIVIPTHNRCSLLTGTLRHLESELASLQEELRAEVKVTIVDNASTDETRNLADAPSVGLIKFKRFDEKVEIGGSIRRAIAEACGKYVWVIGDDDYFQPGFLRYLLAELRDAQGIALFYFNRLILDWEMRRVRSVAHSEWDSQEREMPMGQFIKEYSHWPGFITAMVFDRGSYENGEEYDRPQYEGWEFLARIYYGGRSSKARVYNYPFIWQRLGVHSWKAKWPKYWLVNMPKMLASLDSDGVTSESVRQWQDKEVSVKRLVIDALVAKAYGTDLTDPFWADALKYQLGSKRVLLCVIRFFVPCRLASIIYKMQPKYRV